MNPQIAPELLLRYGKSSFVPHSSTPLADFFTNGITFVLTAIVFLLPIGAMLFGLKILGRFTVRIIKQRKTQRAEQRDPDYVDNLLRLTQYGIKVMMIFLIAAAVVIVVAGAREIFQSQ